MSGKLVTIEGLDTAGKSTQVELLANKLRLDGYKVEVIHFPFYDGEIGKVILKHLKGECSLNREALQMLYVADQMSMREHIEQLLSKGYIVICDRYDLSTAVYYGAGEEDFEECIDGFKHVYTDIQKNLLRPDITLIIDLPVEEIKKRKKQLDIFESSDKFMARCRALYKHSTYVIFDNRVYMKIDGTASVNSIESTIYDKVKRSL